MLNSVFSNIYLMPWKVVDWRNCSKDIMKWSSRPSRMFRASMSMSSYATRGRIPDTAKVGIPPVVSLRMAGNTEGSRRDTGNRDASMLGMFTAGISEEVSRGICAIPTPCRDVLPGPSWAMSESFNYLLNIISHVMICNKSATRLCHIEESVPMHSILDTSFFFSFRSNPIKTADVLDVWRVESWDTQWTMNRIWKISALRKTHEVI